MGSEKALSSLFQAPDPQRPLSARDQALREIYESVFTLWHEHPARSDQQMAEWVVQRYGRTRRQALDDIATVKTALGNVHHAAKEWHRYRVMEMLSHAYQVAEAANDVGGMVRAASQIGRFSLLDKQEEKLEIDWEEFCSTDFEPSADAELLGIPDRTDTRAARARLERRYGIGPAATPADTPLEDAQEDTQEDPEA